MQIMLCSHIHLGLNVGCVSCRSCPRVSGAVVFLVACVGWQVVNSVGGELLRRHRLPVNWVQEDHILSGVTRTEILLLPQGWIMTLTVQILDQEQLMPSFEDISLKRCAIA